MLDLKPRMRQPVAPGAAPQAASPGVRVSCIRSIDELAARRAAWTALLERAGTFTPFQTFEWHAAWWQVFGDGFEPFVLCVEDAGELIGIAPLMLTERRLLGRRLRVAHFIGLYQSDYCDFILDEDRPDALGLMLDWLAGHPQEWDALDLRNLEGGSPRLRAVLEFYAARGYGVEQRQWNEAPTYTFGDADADAELLKKKSLRRHYNYFRRQGALEFRNLTTADDVEPHLATFFQQHVERWGRTETPSQFLQEQPRDFCRELVGRLAPTGCLRFAVVALDGRTIACHLGFECNGRFFWYKPTFDVALSQHSPGEVLIKYLLEDASARGLLEFDFGPGEEAFKYRFANYTRAICSAHV